MPPCSEIHFIRGRMGWGSLCEYFMAFCQEVSREKKPFLNLVSPRRQPHAVPPLGQEAGSPHVLRLLWLIRKSASKRCSPEPKPPCLEASPGASIPTCSPKPSPARYEWRGEGTRPRSEADPGLTSIFTPHLLTGARTYSLRSSHRSQLGWPRPGMVVSWEKPLKLPFPATWGRKCA